MQNSTNNSIIWIDTVDSTNDEAKRKIHSLSHLSVIAAYEQTSGRGQRGNIWSSEAGKNLTFSIIIKYGKDGYYDLIPSNQFIISKITSIAVLDLLSKYGIKAEIKWPNDIYVNDKKIAGILIEHTLHGNSIAYSIIGIGINVNQMQFLEELNGKATSLAKELSKEFDRDVIIDKVVESFYYYYEKFLATEDLSALKEIYNQMLVNQDKEVVIHEPGNEYHARAIGINEQGELIVETVDGRQQNIYAGEVSVRGVYGYV